MDPTSSKVENKGFITSKGTKILNPQTALNPMPTAIPSSVSIFALERPIHRKDAKDAKSFTPMEKFCSLRSLRLCGEKGFHKAKLLPDFELPNLPILYVLWLF